MKNEIDVLIIGAGPTGLVAASELARHNISCKIIDKLGSPLDKSRAVGIHARTLELFEKMGIVDQFLKKGKKVQKVGSIVKGKVKASFQIDLENLTTNYPYFWFLEQYDTEKILTKHLESYGISVERNVELKGFTYLDKKIISNLSTGESITSSYILGCDGANSRVREVMDVSFEGGDYSDLFLLADVKADWPYENNQVWICPSPKGVLVRFPLNDGELSRFIIVGQICKEFTKEKPLTLQEFNCIADEILSGHLNMKECAWITPFYLKHRCVASYKKGNAFLLGDAAHVHSPVGGQGMNTGIQDACNLAWKLSYVIKNQIPENILETYQEERLPVGKTLLKTTDRVFSFISSLNPFLRRARCFMIPFFMKNIVKIPFIYKNIIPSMMMLKTHYKSSSLSKMSDKSLISAGERAPDGTLSKGKRLFELMNDEMFHLFVFSTKEKLKKTLPSIISVHYFSKDIAQSYAHFDSKGEIHLLYKAKVGTIYLIRPDGYIAFSGSVNDLEVVLGYFM